MQLRRVVFICPITPNRNGIGLARRMSLFADALARVGQLDVIVVPVAGAGQDGADAKAVHGKVHRIDIANQCDTHFGLLSRLNQPDIRLAAFRDYGKPSLSRFLTNPVLDQIATIIQACQPDLIHVGRSYLLSCLDRLTPDCPVTLDLDEDDLATCQSQARLALRQGDLIQAQWLRQEGRAMDALIARHVPTIAHVFVCSRIDLSNLKARHPDLPLCLIENPVDLPDKVRTRPHGSTVLFVGAMGYGPNIDGILWFAREILPKLRNQPAQAIRLTIVGPGPPREILALSRHPRISVAGHVPQLAPLYQTAALVVAPLRAGGGTRIKLLEAAAHGVASVATPVAAMGLAWPKPTGGWIGATAGDFAQACAHALSDPAERRRRAQLGRLFVAKNHERSLLMAKLAAIYACTLET